MFQGVLPAKVIAQMVAVGDFGSWREIYSCCSGTFRFERAVLSKHPGAVIRSNDVSLFTSAMGAYLTGDSFDLRFKGELAFVEELVGDDFEKRVAAVIVALDMAGFGIGKIGRYKEEHLRYFRRDFGARIGKAVARLRKLAEECPIASFHPRDWREHADEAIANGAGVAAFPPFFRLGYERMFKFIDENVEWPAPRYDIYDPKELRGILDKLQDSGIPYCVISDQLFADLPLVSEYLQGRGRPHYVYARTNRSSVVRLGMPAQPFTYNTVKPDRLGPDTRVTLMPCEAKQANYIRECHLSRRIVPASGMVNYLVYLDDMLLGCLVYSLSTMPTVFGADSLYLLADVCTTREGRFSKLLARLALSRAAIEPMNVRYVNRFTRVVTTAFSAKPASMKYRGSYQVFNRRPADDGDGFIINYVGEVLPDGPQDIWRWYWQRDGKKALGQAQA